MICIKREKVKPGQQNKRQKPRIKKRGGGSKTKRRTKNEERNDEKETKSRSRLHKRQDKSETRGAKVREFEKQFKGGTSKRKRSESEASITACIRVRRGVG